MPARESGAGCPLLLPTSYLVRTQASLLPVCAAHGRRYAHGSGQQSPDTELTFFLRYSRRHEAIVLMGSDPVVPHEVTADILLGRCLRHIAHRRHPLGFQATKQSLHRCVVMAISSSAHALRHAIAPKSLAKTTAGILATLVAVKQKPARSAAHFVGLVERLDNQVCVWSF